MKADQMLCNRKGFTLIEMMIAVLVSGIIIGGIITTFLAMRDSYYVQDEVAAMQQQTRAALEMMVQDIRLAGYDPTREADDATIVQAASGRLQVTMDRTDDGGAGDPDGDCADANEDVTYGFSSANDSEPDGIADSGAANLGRETGGGFQPLAEHIHALAFAYAFDEDEDGDLDQSGGNVIWAIDSDAGGNLDRNLDTNTDGEIDSSDTAGGVALGAPVTLDKIRAVRIWMLARSENEDREFSNNQTYVVGAKRVAVNDGYRRRLLETTVQCRNLGL